MPTNEENNSTVKDYLNIDNLKGNTNGVNSPLLHTRFYGKKVA